MRLDQRMVGTAKDAAMTRVAAFHPNGHRVVATVDWIPAIARIDPACMRLDEDGGLSIETLEIRPLWDGAATQTERGFMLFETADGDAVPEDRLVLRALDAAGAPCGDPLPFTAVAASTPFNDAALMAASRALLIAAEIVASQWSSSTLAEAVRDLDAAAQALRRLMPNGAAASPITPTAREENPS